MILNHASLFSGIGGFDLAAEMMGWKNVFQVEKDPFCRRVLNKNFPDVKRHGDIKKFKGEDYRGTIDILTGGFPCQPFSLAGERLGTADVRHLWPENYRIVREVQPPLFVGENVYGLVNWSKGLVFEQVQADLEAIGYEVHASILPACGVNAPHRRNRVWFVAYSEAARSQRLSIREKEEFTINGKSGGSRIITNANSNDAWRCGYGEAGQTQGENKTEQEERERIRGKFKRTGQKETTSDPQRFRQSGQGRPIESISSTENKDWKASWSYDDGRWPTQSPLRSGNDGLSPNVVRSAIKGAGNAIVPQLAFQIFKAIEETYLTTLNQHQ